MAGRHRSTRLYFFMMLLSAAWALMGAPIFPGEWAALPGELLLMLRQTPRRMLSVLRCWLA